MDIYQYIKIFESLGFGEHMPQTAQISERYTQFNGLCQLNNLPTVNMFNLPNAFLWKIDEMPQIKYRPIGGGQQQRTHILTQDDYLFYHHPQSPQVLAYERTIIGVGSSPQSFEDFFKTYIKGPTKEIWIIIQKQSKYTTVGGQIWRAVKFCAEQPAQQPPQPAQQPPYMLEYLETSVVIVTTPPAQPAQPAHPNALWNCQLGGPVSIYKNYNIKTDADNILYGYHSDRAQCVTDQFNPDELMPTFATRQNPRTTWIPGPDMYNQQANGNALDNWEPSAIPASADQAKQAHDCVNTWVHKLVSIGQQPRLTNEQINQIRLHLFNNWNKKGSTSSALFRRQKRNISYDWLAGTTISCNGNGACYNKCEIEHTFSIMTSWYLGTLFNSPISFEDSSKISNQWKHNGSFAKITSDAGPIGPALGASPWTGGSCPATTWVIQYHQIMMFIITLFRGPMYGYSNEIVSPPGGPMHVNEHIDEIVGPTWYRQNCPDTVEGATDPVMWDKWQKNIRPAPLRDIFANIQTGGLQPTNVGLLNIYGNSQDPRVNLLKTYSWIISEQNNVGDLNVSDADIGPSIRDLNSIISSIDGLDINYLHAGYLNNMYRSCINGVNVQLAPAVLYVCRTYSQIVQRMIRVTGMVNSSTIIPKRDAKLDQCKNMVATRAVPISTIMGLSLPAERVTFSDAQTWLSAVERLGTFRSNSEQLKQLNELITTANTDQNARRIMIEGLQKNAKKLAGSVAIPHQEQRSLHEVQNNIKRAKKARDKADKDMNRATLTAANPRTSPAAAALTVVAWDKANVEFIRLDELISQLETEEAALQRSEPTKQSKIDTAVAWKNLLGVSEAAVPAQQLNSLGKRRRRNDDSDDLALLTAAAAADERDDMIEGEPYEPGSDEGPRVCRCSGGGPSTGLCPNCRKPYSFNSRSKHRRKSRNKPKKSRKKLRRKSRKKSRRKSHKKSRRNKRKKSRRKSHKKSRRNKRKKSRRKPKKSRRKSRRKPKKSRRKSRRKPQKSRKKSRRKPQKSRKKSRKKSRRKSRRKPKKSFKPKK